jgi:hypothetical protein
LKQSKSPKGIFPQFSKGTTKKAKESPGKTMGWMLAFIPFYLQAKIAFAINYNIIYLN